jgi:polyisoprenoid-binding protein YceI
MSIPTGTYVIDPAHSELGFTVRHSGIAKVRGRFNGVDGTITLAEPLTDSTATVTIDAASVDTGNEQRDGHLVSADFWDAENNPTWTFESTSVEGEGEEFTLNGALTINGVTLPVALETEYNGAATDAFGNDRAGFSASTEISRKDYGLTWNVALEGGGLLVGDKVKIAIEISAIKQA